MVSGAGGRMGQRLMAVIAERPDLELVGALEWSGSPVIGRDAGELVGVGHSGVSITHVFSEAAKDAQVYLDFSSPQGALSNLEGGVLKKIAAVIGVTALGPEFDLKAKEASKKIPILVAPNMSFGVNLLYKVSAEMAKLLGPDYDIEIVEAHHNRKKDAPSGTALKLQEHLAKARGFDPLASQRLGRSGTPGPRTREEIGIHAIRGGDIVGDHTVIFSGPGEVLEITHRAQTRDAFVNGALAAALWIAKKEKGCYSFGEILGI
jgi:4-hydroxy-tetrahydrodipicolinate reductase